MKFLIGLLFVFSTTAFGADQVPVKVATLINAATTTGAGSSVMPAPVDKTFVACGAVSNSTGASVIKIQVSNAATPGTLDWIDLGSITLSLTTSQSCDGFASSSRWKWYRGNVSSISGTGAAVSALMGY